MSKVKLIIVDIQEDFFTPTTIIDCSVAPEVSDPFKKLYDPTFLIKQAPELCAELAIMASQEKHPTNQ